MEGPCAACPPGSSLCVLALGVLLIIVGVPQGIPNHHRSAHAAVVPLTARIGGQGPPPRVSGVVPPPAVAWANLTAAVGPGPPSAIYEASAFDGFDRNVLLSGGVLLPTGVSSNQTWTYRGGIWSNITSTAGVVDPVEAALLAYDPATQCVVRFGGVGPLFAVINETWDFCSGRWQNVTAQMASSPPPQEAGPFGASLVYDSIDSELLLFTATNGTWAYSKTTWSLVGPSPPFTTHYPIVDDPADGYVMTVAQGNTTTANATWTYHGGNWTRLLVPTSAPIPPFQYYTPPSMAYDPGEGAIVAIAVQSYPGGNCNCTETWVYETGNWTLRLSTPFPAGSSSSPLVPPDVLAPDGADGYLLYWEANDLPVQHRWPVTWAFGFVPPYIGGFRPTPSRIYNGNSSNLTVVTLGGVEPLTYTYGSLPSGCASENVSVLPCAPASAGTYYPNVRVTDALGRNASASATLVVVDPPHIATFTVRPGSSQYSGLPVQFTVEASGGFTPLTYAYTGLPHGCLSVDTPNLTCSPQATGNFSIAAVVTDVLGTATRGSLNLTVVARPSLAVSVSPSSVEIDAGQAVTISGEVGPGGYTVSANWSGLPPGCGPDSSLNLSCTPEGPGDFRLTLSVKSSEGYRAVAVAELTVNSKLAVVLTASPSNPLRGTRALVIANLTGGTAPFTYRWTGLTGAQCSDVGNVTESCLPTVPGSYSISVSVADCRNETASATIILKVAASFLGLPQSEGILAVVAACGVAVAAALAALLWRRRRSREPLASASAAGGCDAVGDGLDSEGSGEDSTPSAVSPS